MVSCAKTALDRSTHPSPNPTLRSHALFQNSVTITLHVHNNIVLPQILAGHRSCICHLRQSHRFYRMQRLTTYVTTITPQILAEAKAIEERRKAEAQAAAVAARRAAAQPAPPAGVAAAAAATPAGAAPPAPAVARCGEGW